MLRAGGLSACLSYIDFFSTSLQRVAVTIAANICRTVPADCFHMVYDMVPNMTNLLQYQGRNDFCFFSFVGLSHAARLDVIVYSPG